MDDKHRNFLDLHVRRYYYFKNKPIVPFFIGNLAHKKLNKLGYNITRSELNVFSYIIIVKQYTEQTGVYKNQIIKFFQNTYKKPGAIIFKLNKKGYVVKISKKYSTERFKISKKGIAMMKAFSFLASQRFNEIVDYVKMDENYNC